MSTRQAEDILKHTFKQLEQMVDDVRSQKTASSPEKGRKGGTSRRKKPTSGSGKNRN